MPIFLALKTQDQLFMYIIKLLIEANALYFKINFKPLHSAKSQKQFTVEFHEQSPPSKHLALNQIKTY